MMLAGVIMAGCSVGGHPIALVPQPALDDRDVLEFKDHGERVSIQSVKFAGDSVSGVNWRYPTEPRHSYALADISESKVNRASDAAAGMGQTVLGLGLLAAVLVLYVGPRIGGN